MVAGGKGPAGPGKTQTKGSWKKMSKKDRLKAIKTHWYFPLIDVSKEYISERYIPNVIEKHKEKIEKKRSLKKLNNT